MGNTGGLSNSCPDIFAFKVEGFESLCDLYLNGKYKLTRLAGSGDYDGGNESNPFVQAHMTYDPGRGQWAVALQGPYSHAAAGTILQAGGCPAMNPFNLTGQAGCQGQIGEGTPISAECPEDCGSCYDTYTMDIPEGTFSGGGWNLCSEMNGVTTMFRYGSDWYGLGEIGWECFLSCGGMMGLCGANEWEFYAYAEFILTDAEVYGCNENLTGCPPTGIWALQGGATCGGQTGHGTLTGGD